MPQFVPQLTPQPAPTQGQQPYTAVLCALSAKYVHATLAPWCLAAGVQEYTARTACDEGAPALRAIVVEGTVNEPQDGVLARILSCAPQAVGLSCYLWNLEKTLALAQGIKQAAPDTVVFLGGPEVSYNAADTLRENAVVDCILSGEGEQSVPALLACLARGDSPDTYVHAIPGLCTRAAVSEPCVLTGTPPSPYTPAYLQALSGRIAYLETSRGCPFSCAFCLSGRCGAPRWFALEGEHGVFATLRKLANSGTQTVKLIDRTFNANPAHANAILSFILKHYGGDIPACVCFHFEIAADILREDTLALLAQMPAGAVQLEIGMQSFCEETLAAVRRKTDTARLQSTIRRLIAMGNMHVHIDLIAGLPLEDLHTFAQSFNTGYALGAQMLQLGFLKLLHGAAMREEPEAFPCEYSPRPPYEILRTPWLSEADLALLRLCEDALERVYNSGRFLETAAFALRETGLDAFSFYCALGKAARTEGLATHHVPLDDYTAFLQRAIFRLLGEHAPTGAENKPCRSAENKSRRSADTACNCAQGAFSDTAFRSAAAPAAHRSEPPNTAPAAALLRDAMVRDRLATNATGRLPAALQIADPALASAVKALAQNPGTAPTPGVKRGVALLYGARSICFADYAEKNPVTNRYALREVSWPEGFCGFLK